MLEATGSLILASGHIFRGKILLPKDHSMQVASNDECENCHIGELCFNTSMTGYQEIVTDPSYSGQIIVFTSVHIGNVGYNYEDMESKIYANNTSKPKAIVIRNDITNPSNWAAIGSFVDFCRERNIIVLHSIDTRAVVNTLKRNKGNIHLSQNAMIIWHGAYEYESQSLDDMRVKGQYQKLLASKAIDVHDMTSDVSCRTPIKYNSSGLKSLAVIDYGLKEAMLLLLAEAGFEITVFPSDVTFDRIRGFDAIFLANGPGDPRTTFAEKTGGTIRDIIASGMPTLGICLGYQLLALGLGCKIYKMSQGHRGSNHPVQDLTDGHVEITAQNHGFAIEETSMPSNVSITHRSLFDGTPEGITLEGGSIIAVQHHPEASSGPHDSQHIFRKFYQMVSLHK